MIRDLKALLVDEVIDARGTSATEYVQQVEQSMKRVPRGGVLAILSTDPGASTALRSWAAARQYEYVGALEERCWRVFVKRGSKS